MIDNSCTVFVVVYILPILLSHQVKLAFSFSNSFQQLDLKSLPWHLNSCCTDPDVPQEEISPCFYSHSKRKLLECREAVGAHKKMFSARVEPILLFWDRLIPHIAPGRIINMSCEVWEPAPELYQSNWFPQLLPGCVLLVGVTAWLDFFSCSLQTGELPVSSLIVDV